MAPRTGVRARGRDPCFASWSPQPAVAFDDAALARQAYDGIILPGYARFDRNLAQAFADEAEALCKAPSPTTLDAARAAARATLLAWGRIEPVRFGPVTEQQRLERLLFYPDPHGIAAKQIDQAAGQGRCEGYRAR